MKTATSNFLSWGLIPPNDTGRIAQHVKEEKGRKERKEGKERGKRKEGRKGREEGRKKERKE
jgi:hypothetical protein